MVIENLTIRNGASHRDESKTLIPFVSKQALSGGIGGCATRFFCQPFDVLKIRFQTQIEPINKSSTTSVYRGIFQGFTHIVHNEGWSALWKGHTPAQVLSITFGFLQFGLFEFITKLIHSELPQFKPAVSGVNFTGGLLAGCGATLISFPFDTVRTRMILQHEPKVYKNMGDVVSKMWTQEGPTSLYKGLWPTIIQIGPYAGFQFATYKFLVDLYNDKMGIISPSVRSLLCGAIAGAFAKTVVYPLDLTKKRLQAQGFTNLHQYKGLSDCLLVTVRKEGPSALLKGLSPSLLKALLSSALQFYFYELGLRLLVNK